MDPLVTRRNRERSDTATQEYNAEGEPDRGAGSEPIAPRFAAGTREVPPLIARSSADLDVERALTLTGEPAYAIDRYGRIVDVNELGVQLAGTERELLIGAPLAEVIELDHRDAVASAAATHVRFLPAAGKVRIGRTGALEPVDVLVYPHDAARSLVVVRPAARVVPTLREDDIAMIAHDLKNPLSRIALEVELLDHRLEAGDAVDVRRITGGVLRNVRYLDRLVQDLLDVCSLNAGMLWLRKQPTELCTLVKDAVDRVSSPTERARVFIEAPVPVVLSLDEMRIERVIANFVTNGLKYAPGVSGIIVRVETLATCARVSVTDAGPGMTAIEMSYIFEKYRRTHAARGYEGSGLGLYVSKQIIDAHGGLIGVDSLHGVGSRFFFELPL